MTYEVEGGIHVEAKKRLGSFKGFLEKTSSTKNLNILEILKCIARLDMGISNETFAGH
ncbi:hypothetical protein NBRC116591_22860 [Sessilibacter corallicola]|uniref:Uncharacterized protein n=1 Tax=Sessilibacter corallicola TaxID=2904075 RepID=A0ABQ0A9Z6_9GAMM